MKVRHWLWMVALAPACMSGNLDLNSTSGDSVAAAASSLTNKVDFEGGTLEDGDVPESDDPTLVIEPIGSTLLISPGDANVLMPIEFDEEDEDDPIVATLIQFKGSKKHIEVEMDGKRAITSGGRVSVENSFSVDDDVCDSLCDRRFDLEVVECGKRRSGKVGRHATRTMRLDCRGRGDRAKCSAPVEDAVGDEGGTMLTDDPNGGGEAGRAMDPAPTGGSSAGIPTGEFGSRYLDLIQRRAEADCNCFPELCDQITQETQQEAMCTVPLLDELEATGEANSLDCALIVLEDDITCSESSECDALMYQDCLYARDAFIERCPPPPIEVATRLAECDMGSDGGVIYDFNCNDGQIATVVICDGFAQCADGTDESGCGGSGPGTFYCGDGSAIPQYAVCDGVVNCQDAEDEAGCNGDPEFRCNSGELVPQSWYCDGYPDCGDGSDEPPGCGGIDEWVCPYSGVGISPDQVCDGIDNCPDAEDEIQGCGIGELGFDCGNGEVVPSDVVCNGVADCGLPFDEVNCEADMWICADGVSMIPGYWVCDQEADCPNGDDEEQCVPLP